MFDLELIQVTTVGLPSDYDTFVNTFSLLFGHIIFDNLHSKLQFYENRIQFQKGRESIVHHAFIATSRSLDQGAGHFARNRSNHSAHKAAGHDNRNKKGRWKNNYNNKNNKQSQQS